MRRELILLALLVLCACVRFHGEKRNHRNKFKRFLNRIKNFTPEQFQKFQTEFLSDKKPQKETHRQAEIARKVNKLKTTWTATEYKRDYKPLLGAILDGKMRLPRKTFEKKRNDLPDSYDPRDEFPNCESLKEIRDQANCGSCWAFGAVEAMSDRICIKSGQTDQRRVSSQNLVTCCYYCGFGCEGGYPGDAWDYWVETGIVTGGGYQDKTYCQPYFLPECDHHTEGPHGPCPDIADTPDCVTNCDDGNQQPYDSEMTKGTLVFINMSLVIILEDMLLNYSDGVLKMEPNIGLQLTLGMKIGEIMEHSKYLKDLMNAVLKMKFVLVYLIFK